MKAGSVSVFIITRDEEANIGRCLRSAAWADEIVVVDSGSRDKTREIAAELGAKVIERPFTDYADQKNFALRQTSGEWALSIDADEEITDGLRAEILRAVAHPGADAYRIRRRSSIFGRFFRGSGTQEDRPVRLLRKDKAVFRQPVHETVDVAGRIDDLKEPLLHYTYRSIGDYLKRFNRYTSMEADLLKETPPRAFDTTLKPLAAFFRLYALKKGFLDGRAGFFFCALSGYYVFVKHCKQAERRGEAAGG